MTSRNLSVALLMGAAAALALGGCGKQGELQRPRPLIGHATQPAADQATRDRAAMRAAEDTTGVTDPQAPQSVEEVRGLGEQVQRPPPNGFEYTAPGAPQGPDQPQTQGVLPDPLRPSTVPE